MRLEADDHDILHPEFGRIVCAARRNRALLAADLQCQPVDPHGGEVSAARHETDIGACARQLDTEVTADRPGAIDADFHRIFRNRGWI
jgi:hypothetical protein